MRSRISCAGCDRDHWEKMSCLLVPNALIKSPYDGLAAVSDSWSWESIMYMFYLKMIVPHSSE